MKRISKRKISFEHNRLFLGHWKWKSIFFASHKDAHLYLIMYMHKKNNRPQNRVRSTNDLPRRQDVSLRQVNTKVEFCHSISLLCFYTILLCRYNIYFWTSITYILYIFIYVEQSIFYMRYIYFSAVVVLTHATHPPNGQENVR